MPLTAVYQGWEGYQTSLVNAIAPLTPEQLMWRQSDRVRTAGELACHIAFGRIDWFHFMGAPGDAELSARIHDWKTDPDGHRRIAVNTKPIVRDAALLVHWLKESWTVVESVLQTWSVADLATTYRHVYRGVAYAPSRQWTVWRIMAHDIHHGGQIARILAEQNIEAFQLRALGGHIVEPPLAE